MALDFPSGAIVGTVYTGTNGAVYTFDGIKWRISSQSTDIIPSINDLYNLGSTSSIWNNLFVGSAFIKDTTSATSTNTGALQVTGGVGIGGSLYVGGPVYSQGIRLTGNEIDPIFTASSAVSITATNITNWNTAYNWGNHATRGYLTATVSSHLLPGANSLYDLGSTSSQWRSLYVSTNTIYIGGNALSVVGGNLSLNGNPAAGSTSTLVNGTATLQLLVNAGQPYVVFPDGTTQTTAFVSGSIGSYTPTNVGDWIGSPTVGTISAALDELAQRTTTVESIAGATGTNVTNVFMYNSNASYSMTQNVEYKIPFDTATTGNDAGDFQTTSSQFIPQIAGWYLLETHLNFGGVWSGNVNVSVYKNNNQEKLIGSSWIGNGGGVGGSAFVYSNGSTDIFEIRATQTSGGVQALEHGATKTWFQATWMKS